MSRTALLNSLLAQRILVLDGAMGTMIQSYTLGEADYRGERFADFAYDVKGNNDLLCLTQPHVIKEIHAEYLAAGADILETNSFNATSISMADYHMEHLVPELNFAAARLAREAADEATAQNPAKPRFVAGVLGPTSRTASLSPEVNDPGFRNVSFDQLRLTYLEAIDGLVKGGADILMVETIFDTLNAKAALFAIDEYFEQHDMQLPVMISGTITDASGRTLSGQTVEAFWNSVRHARPLSIGLNCALGPDLLRQYVEELVQQGRRLRLGPPQRRPAERLRRIRHGRPGNGGAHRRMGTIGTIEHRRRLLRHFAGAHRCHRQSGRRRRATRAAGAGTGDAPVWPGAVQRRQGLAVRQRRRTHQRHRLASFARLILEGRYDEALSVARQQVENGAQIIDINMDEGMLDAEAAMVRFLLPDRVGARHRAGADHDRLVEMERDRGRPEVHPGQGRRQFHLHEGRRGQVHRTGAKLCRRYGAAVVVMAFDETGQADTYERKTEICARAYKLLTEKVGFPAEDIIFDPNIFAVATGIEEHANYAVDFIEATRWISQNLPHAHISGGVSQRVASRSAATTRCARRSTPPSCITRSRPDWTWASSTPASWASTRRSIPSCWNASRTCC